MCRRSRIEEVVMEKRKVKLYDDGYSGSDVLKKLTAAASALLLCGSLTACHHAKPEPDNTIMGEEQYISYVTNIASKTFAPEEIDSVDVNAVYDGNYCTIDIEMKSGEWYELGFTGGCLMYVEHYPTRMADMAGWAADSTYINTITGEIFI